MRDKGAGLKVLNHRCSSLRWKGMFIETGGTADVADLSARIYWCVYTQGPLGPDGEVVDEDTCSASRSCYEAL